MTWAKIDDRLHGHIKVRRAREAMALWVVALSYCADELTDGYIANDVPELLMGAAGPAMAAKLAEVGLWDAVEGGWRFHDYHDYNPDAEDERIRREAIAKKRSEAGKRGARSRWQTGKPDSKRDGKPIATCHPAEWQTDGPVPVPENTPLSPPDDKPAEPPKRPDRLRGDDALQALCRGSSNRFAFSASAPQLVALAELAEFAHPAPLTLDDFDLLGRAIAAGAALAWCQQPSLRVLLAKDGAHLFAALDEARAWQTTQAPQASPVRLIKPAVRREPTPEENLRMAAEARAMRERIARAKHG